MEEYVAGWGPRPGQPLPEGASVGYAQCKGPRERAEVKSPVSCRRIQRRDSAHVETRAPPAGVEEAGVPPSGPRESARWSPRRGRVSLAEWPYA